MRDAPPLPVAGARRSRAARPSRAGRTGDAAARWRRALTGLGWLAAWLVAGCFLLVGLAAAYRLKRALNIDVVPGVDMLPDEAIEAAIAAVLALLGV